MPGSRNITCGNNNTTYPLTAWFQYPLKPNPSLIWQLDLKKELVVSDASPLVQLAVSDYLYILPATFRVVIPEEVFEET